MKKTILTMCALTLVGATSLLADSPKYPGWNEENWTEAKIAEINKLDSNYNSWKLIGEFMTAVKATPNLKTDYNLYMAKMTELVKKYGEDKNLVVQSVVQIPYTLKGISDEIYSKLYYTYAGKNDVCGRYVTKYYLLNPQKLGDKFDYQIAYTRMVALNVNYDYNFCNRCFLYLKKYQFKFKDEDLKANLKKLNRIVYPNISQNENWKALAVQIQLMIKVLE